MRFVPYASTLDLESSTDAKPAHSTFRIGCHDQKPRTCVIRDMFIGALLSRVEMEVEVRQSLH